MILIIIIHNIEGRAAIGQLGVQPEAGRPASPAWQAKLLEIIILKCQSIILIYVTYVTMQSTKRVTHLRWFQQFLYHLLSR